LERIIAGVEAGRGVAIVYQNISCVSGKRLALRPRKPAIVIAYRKERVSAMVAAFVEAARTAKLKQCLCKPVVNARRARTRNPATGQSPQNFVSGPEDHVARLLRRRWEVRRSLSFHCPIRIL